MVWLGLCASRFDQTKQNIIILSQISFTRSTAYSSDDDDDEVNLKGFTRFAWGEPRESNKIRENLFHKSSCSIYYAKGGVI